MIINNTDQTVTNQYLNIKTIRFDAKLKYSAALTRGDTAGLADFRSRPMKTYFTFGHFDKTWLRRTSFVSKYFC